MANRCKTTEGAQQCIKARHPKVKGHTWGSRGATKEWNADGTPKTIEAETETTSVLDITDWTCAARTRDSYDGRRYACDRHDEHDPDPMVAGHQWRRLPDTPEPAEVTAPLALTPEQVAAFAEVMDSRRNAAWFDPSPDAPTVTIPTLTPDQPRPALLSGADLLLAEIDQTADQAIRTMGDRYLLDLMVAEFDHEAAQVAQVMDRVGAEVEGRGWFLDFADAARVAGHHPAAAYCYAADRFDPAVSV